MTDLTVLEPIARNLLDKKGTPQAALPDFRRVLLKRVDLLDGIALAYLEMLSSVSPGLAQHDAPEGVAGGKDAAVGHVLLDAHGVNADGGVPIHTKPVRPAEKKAIKPITVRAHRRSTQHRRTDVDRAVALDVMAKSMSSVFGRPILGRSIGQYHWRELPDLRRRLTGQAVDHLLLGRTAAEEAILIDKLLCYASASTVENSALVSDVISAQHFAELEVEASRDALPKLDVSKGAAHAEFVRQLEYGDRS